MSELAVQGIALPGIPDAADPASQLVNAWLVSQKTRNTMIAYRRDVTGVGTGEKPAKLAVPGMAALAGRVRRQPPGSPASARRHLLAAAGRERLLAGHDLRKISAISSLYIYMIREEVTERNPAKWATRPSVDMHVSNTVGLSEDEALALIRAADQESLRTAAIIRVLLYGGWRISLIETAVKGDLGHDRGHRTIKIRLKGGKIVKAPLSPPVNRWPGAYLATRGPSPAMNCCSSRLAAIVLTSLTCGAWSAASPGVLASRPGMSFRPIASATRSPRWHSTTGFPLPTSRTRWATRPRTTRRYDRSRHRLGPASDLRPG